MQRRSWVVWVGPKCHHKGASKRETGTSERDGTKEREAGKRDWEVLCAGFVDGGRGLEPRKQAAF